MARKISRSTSKAKFNEGSTFLLHTHDPKDPNAWLALGLNRYAESLLLLMEEMSDSIDDIAARVEHLEHIMRDTRDKPIPGFMR